MAEVRSICDTDVTDLEIATIITWVDAAIAMKIDVGSTPPLFVTMLCAKYAAYTCYRKDPNARSLGAHSERRDEQLKAMWEEIQVMLDAAGGGISFTPAVETLA